MLNHYVSYPILSCLHCTALYSVSPNPSASYYFFSFWLIATADKYNSMYVNMTHNGQTVLVPSQWTDSTGVTTNTQWKQFCYRVTGVTHSVEINFNSYD